MTTGRRRLGRNIGDRLVAAAGLAALAFGLVTLGVLLTDVLSDGFSRLSWSFLTSYPSRRPADAGIYPALAGSVFLMGLTALLDRSASRPRCTWRSTGAAPGWSG